MAIKRKKGGGFLRGVFYGFIVSVVIFLGLCAVFPITDSAPIAAVGDPIQTAPQAFDVGPGSTDDAGVSVSSVTDSSPIITLGTTLDAGTDVEQPVVETESANIPDIGDGSTTPENGPAVVATADPVSVAPELEVAVTNDAAVPALPDAASGEAFDVFSVPFTATRACRCWPSFLKIRLRLRCNHCLIRVCL